MPRAPPLTAKTYVCANDEGFQVLGCRRGMRRVLTMKCENGRVSDGRVRYARNGDVRLAYREFGEGATTLVWIPGWFSNVDM
jgi:hypothetical protein